MVKRVLEGQGATERAQKRKQLGTLRSENLFLPHAAKQLDLIVSDYLEFLWAQGKGRTEGSNILAGLQDAQPHLKGITHEVPNRAPPLSLDCCMSSWLVILCSKDGAALVFHFC